jgi:acyl-CoA thioester hydrolase
MAKPRWMQKSRVELPAHCSTRFAMRVRFFETDLMGIVHHAAYLTYVEAARVEYLRRRKADYRAFVERGFHMPVVEAHLEYKAPARFDDLLEVEVRLGALTRVTTRFDYRVLRVSEAGEVLLCQGYTLLACVDDAHRPRRLPEDVVELLIGPETNLNPPPPAIVEPV